MDSAISKIQACKTVDEVFAVTNALGTQVQSISSAARVVPGPQPIRSASDLRAWVRELKAAANAQTPKEVSASATRSVHSLQFFVSFLDRLCDVGEIGVREEMRIVEKNP